MYSSTSIPKGDVEMPALTPEPVLGTEMTEEQMVEWLKEVVVETLFTDCCVELGHLAIERIKHLGPVHTALVRRYHEDDPQDPNVVTKFETLHCEQRHQVAADILTELAAKLRKGMCNG